MALQEELESQGNWLFRYRSFLPIAIVVVGTPTYSEAEDTLKDVKVKGKSKE